MSRQGQSLVVFLALAVVTPAWGRGELRELHLEPRMLSYLPGEQLRVKVPEECFWEAEEGELLLQLSGLKVAEVRLTPSQATPRGVLAVTIPHFPGAVAWFELRVGSGGREWIAARSPRFLIVPSAQRPVANVVHKRGEWWLSSHPAPHVASEPNAQGLQKSVGNTEPLWATLQKDTTEKPQPGFRLPLALEATPVRTTRLLSLAFCQRQVSLPLLE
ncbi:MAG: hypothetical protein ACK42L_01625 [Thermoanaerobaculum sp.]